MKEGKVLAIDYGQKSIGLAVSDRARMMAFGHGTLKNTDKDKVLAAIADLINSEEIAVVIVGLPLGKEGEETVQTAVIRKFAGELKDFFEVRKMAVEMDFLDESFSSFEANKILAGLGVKSPDRKKTEDEMAAIVLVHRYIDFRP
jgi:putative Holliday junction resolvase